MVRLLALTLSIVALVACSRPSGKDGASVLTIKVPEARDLHSKTGGVGAMSALPANRKACYGVLVTGAGIGAEGANACRPKVGVHAGFVEPGATVSVEVPKGNDRRVEVFAYLQSVGQNQPCPAFDIGFSASEITKTYSVYSKDAVDMSGDTTALSITPSFPGDANHIAAQLALPAVCTAVAPNGTGAPGFHVSAGQGLAIEDGQTISTGYHLKGRVGRPGSPTVLSSGSGYTLLVK